MADSVVTLWSKSADFSAAVPDFPGVFEKSLWDSEADATKFYGTNGTYISSDVVGSALTHAGAEFTISISDTTGILADMYVWIPETPSLNDEGYYRIKSVQANTTITCEDLALDVVGQVVENDTITHYIGGVSDAFDSSTALREELDLIGPNCGATLGVSENNLDIICHASTALDLDATINIDAISGSTTTRVRVIGTDSDFVDDGTQIEITTTSTLASGLMVGAGTSDYVDLWNIVFNGGGKDVGTAATYGLRCTDTNVAAWGLVNCRFTGCKSHGMNVAATTSRWSVADCEFDNNGGSGCNVLISQATFTGNEFHTNDLHGIESNRGESDYHKNLAYNNGQDNSVGHGFNMAVSASGNRFFNNTSFNNYQSGYFINDAQQNTVMVNNVSYKNGLETVSTGWGYSTQVGTIQPLHFFGHNHANSNRGDDSTKTANDVILDTEFLVFRQGHNILDAPLFVSETPGEVGFLVPTSSSPLIDAGVGGTGDTIGAKCATAGSGAGGLLRHPGMNGGMNG